VYDLNDTIVAVSSPPLAACGQGGARTILRITGDKTFGVCERLFGRSLRPAEPGLRCGSIAVDEQLSIGAWLYLFPRPHSYTGENVAEIHIHTNPAVVEALMDNLLGQGLRMAGPGEFTARAYLNGKIDLAQAEAVNEIVTGSNTFQVAAAERLLDGRLSDSAERIRSEILDCLSLLEAGLDFSTEDIEFIGQRELTGRLERIRGSLEEFLAGSISYESIIELPAVGIAGAANAGKSSLVNALLGEQRSIVSPELKTTRDVLTGILSLAHCRCVLFDCAGLLPEPEGILDELAQQAAIEALRKSTVVVFCVDCSKGDWSEDLAVRQYVTAEALIPVATKTDLLGAGELVDRLEQLQCLFGARFLPVSVVGAAAIEALREEIDRRIVGSAGGSADDRRDSLPFAEGRRSFVALTARHKQAVSEAIEDLGEAIEKAQEQNQQEQEVVAMLLRRAYQALSAIEQPGGADLDEHVLDRIFSRFCIGK